MKTAKDSLDKIRKRDNRQRHVIEKNKLEENFGLEIQSFSEHWENKIKSYQSECKKMEQELLKTNQDSLEKFREELETNIPERGKDSAKLLDMKTQLEHLVRHEEFKDAHFMQQRCFDIERIENEKYQQERKKKIESLLEQRLNQHQNEYNALRKRILNGLDELELQRKSEYDRLYLKYNNLKKNVENQQTMQSYFLEKSIKVESMRESMRNYYGNTPEIPSEKQSAALIEN